MLKSLTPPVAIYFEDVGINTVTQTGELLLVVLAAIAQGESETKSASVTVSYTHLWEIIADLIIEKLCEKYTVEFWRLPK